MQREDKEALFMILERNGVRNTLETIEEIKELHLEDDFESAFEKFLTPGLQIGQTILARSKREN